MFQEGGGYNRTPADSAASVSQQFQEAVDAFRRALARTQCGPISSFQPGHIGDELQIERSLAEAQKKRSEVQSIARSVLQQLRVLVAIATVDADDMKPSTVLLMQEALPGLTVLIEFYTNQLQYQPSPVLDTRVVQGRAMHVASSPRSVADMVDASTYGDTSELYVAQHGAVSDTEGTVFSVIVGSVLLAAVLSGAAPESLLVEAGYGLVAIGIFTLLMMLAVTLERSDTEAEYVPFQPALDTTYRYIEAVIAYRFYAVIREEYRYQLTRVFQKTIDAERAARAGRQEALFDIAAYIEETGLDELIRLADQQDDALMSAHARLEESPVHPPETADQASTLDALLAPSNSVSGSR